MTWLSEHCAARRAEVARRKAAVPEAELRRRAAAQPPARDFAAALHRPGPLPVIAEIKFRSPSAGELRKDRDVEFVARSYELNGAAALSVLVDEAHFAGRLDYVERAHMATSLPILAKGFFVDPYEVLEARLARADAVLLIAGCLERETLAAMHALAGELGMDALVELHDDADLRKLEGLEPGLVGVNHRNLATLAMDLDLTVRLAPHLPEGSTRVAESGLSTAGDLARMKVLGYHGALVGTRFMSQADPGAALATLLDTAGALP